MSQEEKLPKILIVEDDERLARLTQEYLIRNGLEVGVEPDGNRAIRRIIAEQPDMVVLDVMLPGADGLTICREVRPHYHQPILMLTARTEDMDQVLGLEMGADDYVAKPVQPSSSVKPFSDFHNAMSWFMFTSCGIQWFAHPSRYFCQAHSYLNGTSWFKSARQLIIALSST